MAKRDFADQPLTAFAAATGADHVPRRASLVEENQPFRVKRTLVLFPLGAGLGNVGAILLGRVQSLFKTDIVPSAIGTYKRSKIVAEQIVETMIARDRLPAIIVHPSTPVGPRDAKPTPTGRIIVEAALGRIPGYVDTGLDLVHVDDVASGHLAALQQAKLGEHCILGGQDVSLAEMLEDIAKICGRKPPRLRFSRPLLYPFAVAAEGMARFTDREPFMTVDGLRMSRRRMFFSSAEAQCDLGYTARPYREALADAVTWFAENGHLR
jgi:dihydroflavonol-4-reductase